MSSLARDTRIVLTLDAGGTNFDFSAIQGRQALIPPHRLPANGDDLHRCLETIVEGFTAVKSKLGRKRPAAISFAFPGPADYRAGVIGRLQNLPAFQGGVALGPLLEDHFGLPVFINNDGDLFALGEAIGGLLPFLNGLLERAGSDRRYRNLLGVTLGTGFGAGIVSQGQLWQGDTSTGGEIFLMRNRIVPESFAEDSVSIRAVERAYAVGARVLRGAVPTPAEIFDIAMGRRRGNQDAAKKAFTRLARAAADAIANAVTMLDCCVVIGGGLAGAHELILPALVGEMNGQFERLSGERHQRLLQQIHNLEDASDREAFLTPQTTEITVPDSSRRLSFDPSKRLALGVSRLGTCEAVALGAYAFALQKLDEGRQKRNGTRTKKLAQP